MFSLVKYILAKLFYAKYNFDHSSHISKLLESVELRLFKCVFNTIFCKSRLDFTMVSCWYVTINVFVYPETFGEKELGQLASVINSCVFGGIFPRKTYNFCCKGIPF